MCRILVNFHLTRMLVANKLMDIEYASCTIFMQKHIGKKEEHREEKIKQAHPQQASKHIELAVLVETHQK